MFLFISLEIISYPSKLNSESFKSKFLFLEFISVIAITEGFSSKLFINISNSLILFNKLSALVYKKVRFLSPNDIFLILSISLLLAIPGL